MPIIYDNNEPIISIKFINLIAEIVEKEGTDF
jgi:hypothetical protein